MSLQTMKYSRDGLALTEGFEGCRLVSYQDQVNVWTIGYGHTRGVHPGMTCTQPQAEAWLREDVVAAEDAIKRLVKIELSQKDFDALVDFVFNLGVGNFASSSLLKKVNAGDLVGAAAEFVKWDMAGGQHVAGLRRRRDAERAMFLAGIAA